jgi:hypothetical protein
MNWKSLTAILLTLTSFCLAQDSTSSDSETIRQLVLEVKELQQEVQILKAKEQTPGAEPIDANVTSSAPEQAPPQETLPNMHDVHGIQWRGFGEVDYKVLNQNKPELGTYGFVPGSAGNFYTGDFDLLLTSQLTDKLGVLSEIVFGEQDAQTFDVDLERILLKYDLSDHFKFSFGRYHTAIGYYNMEFNSAAWTQTTADRPLIMEFANYGGPLPTQAVGGSVTGEIPTGKLGLNYTFEYGSSDTVRPDLNGISTLDENNGNHVNAGWFVRPAFVSGLQVGNSFYHDQISDFLRGPNVRLGQTIINAHVVYVTHRTEFLNEGFVIRHAYCQLPVIYNMPAFYTQISHRFGHVRPYFRYQYINANPGSILRDIRLRRGPSFGARYDFNEFIGFKAQFDQTLRKDQPDLDGAHFQLVFTF